MKVKKFTCNSCGAPKVNAYKSPYIMCDFCGSFCDIDYTLGFDSWNIDPKRTHKYQKADMKIQSELADLLRKNKKKEYYQLQEKYWDLYYKTFPEYLPPTINPDKPVYREYIYICADYSTNAAYDPFHTVAAESQKQYQASVEYEYIDGVSKVKSEGFFRMITHYIQYVKDSFKVFYETPEYEVMHKLLPPDTHLKMKISTLVQTWLPYLKEEDAKLFLEQTGFTQEYTEMLKIKGTEIACEHCSESLFVPENSLKVHCENCHKTNIVKDKFSCISCGTENNIPDLPVNTMECSSCGTENKLIVPLFS